MAAVAASGVIVPVPVAEPVVGRWRTRWDPAARLGVPAHVTLLYPFVAPPVAGAVVAELRTVVASVVPFAVTYAGCARFAGNVVYLEPSPSSPFVALTRALVARWPEHPPYGGAYDTVVPHLTVCDGAPDDVCVAAVDAVSAALPLVGEAREAWLIEQSAPYASYAVTARLPFGG